MRVKKSVRSAEIVKRIVTLGMLSGIHPRGGKDFTRSCHSVRARECRDGFSSKNVDMKEVFLFESIKIRCASLNL